MRLRNAGRYSHHNFIWCKITVCVKFEYKYLVPTYLNEGAVCAVVHCVQVQEKYNYYNRMIPSVVAVVAVVAVVVY